MNLKTRMVLCAMAISCGVLLDCGATARAGVISGTSAPAAQEGVSFDISPRIGGLYGNTTYQIGGFFNSPEGSGYTMSPLSELKFPLDVEIVNLAAGFRAGFPYHGRSGPARFGWALALEGEYGWNLTKDAGTMQDSDWTEPEFPDFKTIYSESDAELKASVWDVRARFYPVEGKGTFLGWRVGLGGGYLHQQFDYDVSNVSQWSIYPEYNGWYDGKVLTYEVTYEIPYAEIAAGMTFGEGRTISGAVDARFAYSPWAHASDRDDHILRSKLSEGSCDGDAVIFTLRGRLTFYQHYFATLGVTGIAIDTKGTQTQTQYADTDEGQAGLIGTIDQKIFSEQTVIDIGLGFAF